MEAVFLLIAGLVVYFWLNQGSSKSPGREVLPPSRSSAPSARGPRGGRRHGQSGEATRLRDYEALLNATVAAGGRVELIYVDKDGNRTTRIVRPLKVFDYDYGEGLMRCVRAHCQLRQAERTFAIFRTKSLRRL